MWFRRLCAPGCSVGADSCVRKEEDVLFRAPSLHLPAQGLKVPLHAVHSDRQDVREAQVLGVLDEYRREHACALVKMGAPNSIATGPVLYVRLDARS